MKRKLPARVNRSSPKLQKSKGFLHAPSPVPSTHPAAQKKPLLQDDPRFAQAVHNYEAGVKAMQEHKFERARGYFEKVMADAPRELADRAFLHLNTCNQQLERISSSFKTVEEHYDYAISMMNAGNYEGARAHLQKLIRKAPKADYVWYGLALLDCVTHRYEPALKNLAEAIRLNRASRIHARNDSDFQNLGDDPRFTELLYPEAEEQSAKSSAEPSRKSSRKRKSGRSKSRRRKSSKRKRR